MDKNSIKGLFDQQAAGYDQQWARLSPLRDCLHLLVQSLFAGLREDTRLLSVGAGTGAEIAFFARAFPRWRFTAVDPSGSMIGVCRQRAEAGGFLSRCSFHVGYIDSLPEDEPYDAATCFLVSQFLLDRDERTGLFRAIATHLRPDGLLASTDLASDTNSAAYEELLPPWFTLMASSGLDAEKLERMRANYARDVAILPPAEVASLIATAGFTSPVQFFQAGLIHGWFARRAG
ncbi:MAG TPA: methyltransferase domain-containing protein [Steroidobacteraceae bacterium]|nr:methyltransferase domain-containing protein [Steroidobacteraceae bacterium]